jgi:hypothetical protein
MWDAAQPMIEFEPAIKALEPKQTDSQSMGSAIRRDGFCSSMRAGERLSQAGGECKAIGFVGRLGMIGDERASSNPGSCVGRYSRHAAPQDAAQKMGVPSAPASPAASTSVADGPCRNSRSGRGQVARRGLAGAPVRENFEFDLLAFAQIVQSGALDGRDMDEDKREGGSTWGDETNEPFRGNDGSRLLVREGRSLFAQDKSGAACRVSR